jgi:hypothetical protein
MKQELLMPRRKPYRPCGLDGKMGSAVDTPEDFTDFCTFMLDQSEPAKASRKLAYERLAPDGVASPEAKIEFVRTQALGYLKASLRKGNASCAHAISSDADDMDEAQTELVVAELNGQFSALVSAVGQDVFQGLLLASNMTDAARHAVARAIWAGRDFAKEMVQVALSAEFGRGAAALEHWRSTPQARKSLTGPLSSAKAADRVALDPKYGVYQPLIKYLNEHLLPSQRAEFFARFEDYARSGWLDNDLRLGAATAESPLASTPAAHEWRALAARVLRGENVPSSEVSDALYPRMAELSLQIAVRGPRGKSTTWTALDRPMKPEDIDAVAPSGTVDSFTVDPSGGALVTFASSDERLSRQNDQWPAHMVAVDAHAEAMGVSRVTYRVLAPCLVADDGPKQGAAKAGAALEAWFGGAQACEARVRSLLNAMPFANEVLAGAADVLGIAGAGSLASWASRLEFDVIGSERNAWPEIQKRLAHSEDPEAELSRALFGMASELLKAFADAAPAAGRGGATGVQRVDKAGPQIKLFLEFVESVGRLAWSQPPEPEALEEFLIQAERALDRAEGQTARVHLRTALSAAREALDPPAPKRKSRELAG